MVGGGPMGTAAARSLAERGVHVALVEQFPLGHDRGSTAGPTRILRLAYPDPFYVEMAQKALVHWHLLEAASGERLFVRTGGLDAGPHAIACADALATCGARHAWLVPEEAERQHPWLSADGLDGVLFHPDAGVCRTKDTIAAQARLATEAGAEIRVETRVRGVEASGSDVVVDTEDGELSAAVCVLTAGAWAPTLAAATGGAFHLEVTLTHVAYFASKGGPIDATFVETAEEDSPWYAYLVPDGGSGASAKVGQILAVDTIDPATGPFPVDEAWIRSHESFARHRFPGLVPEAVSSETCFYGATADDDFIIDRIGPLVLGFGFGGHGFKFTPLVGNLLADLATGVTPAVPLERFAARRPPVSHRDERAPARRFPGSGLQVEHP